MGQVPRELVPARSVAHALGAELRRRRIDRGLSQALLGGAHPPQWRPGGEDREGGAVPVGRVLRAGRRRSRHGRRPRPDAPAGRPAGQTEYICFVEPSWTLDASLRSLRELTGGRVDRRDFLALTGSALAATATSWSAAIEDPGQSVQP